MKPTLSPTNRYILLGSAAIGLSVFLYQAVVPDLKNRRVKRNAEIGAELFRQRHPELVKESKE